MNNWGQQTVKTSIGIVILVIVLAIAWYFMAAAGPKADGFVPRSSPAPSGSGSPSSPSASPTKPVFKPCKPNDDLEEIGSLPGIKRAQAAAQSGNGCLHITAKDHWTAVNKQGQTMSFAAPEGTEVGVYVLFAGSKDTCGQDPVSDGKFYETIGKKLDVRVSLPPIQTPEITDHYCVSYKKFSFVFQIPGQRYISRLTCDAADPDAKNTLGIMTISRSHPEDSLDLRIFCRAT